VVTQSANVGSPAVAATAPPPRLGLFEFVRRVRQDQLSLIFPETYTQEISFNRFLFLDSFLINKPEYIEHVLLTNHANYRKSHFQRSLFRPLLGDGLLTSEGDFWRRQRRIAAPAFHNRRIAEFVTTMAACTQSLLARWGKRRGPFDLSAEMMALSLDIIARTMFSTEVSADVEAIRKLTRVVVSLRPSLLDLIGLPEWLPRYQPRAYREAIAAFNALMTRFLSERADGQAERGDLLSLLLSARDAETGEGMSEKQLRSGMLTIFQAGHETTSNALTWTFCLLAQNPEAEARLHEEIDRVLGGRAPTYADLGELKWTRMVIEETMRLYPPAHSIGRSAIGEDELGGMRVRPGAHITISIFVVHRNPNLWPDPERFDPERFAPANVGQRHRFAYLPFGGGPRICIGNSFAMAEAQVALATIAQRYRLRLAPGRVVEPIGLITLRPKDGMWMTLEPRERALG
jgi:cytochrome P450